MSWVSDVLICLNLEERFDNEMNVLPSCKPVDEINRWLEERELGQLAELSTHMSTGGKAAQCYVYGGSFSFLKIDEFREFVFSRSWAMPDAVQLFINDEEDDMFKELGPSN